jgi:hypothetical protein
MRDRIPRGKAPQIIIVAPHKWAKGKDIAEAKKKFYSLHGALGRKYAIYVAPHTATLDAMGGFTWQQEPGHFEPFMIDQKGGR